MSLQKCLRRSLVWSLWAFFRRISILMWMHICSLVEHPSECLNDYIYTHQSINIHVVKSRKWSNKYHRTERERERERERRSAYSSTSSSSAAEMSTVTSSLQVKYQCRVESLLPPQYRLGWHREVNNVNFFTSTEHQRELLCGCIPKFSSWASYN